MAIPTGRKRTFSVNLSKIDKSRIFVSEKTGDKYLNLETWDYDEEDQYKQHFSVAHPLSDEQKQKKEKDPNYKPERIFLGNGKVWPSETNTRQITEEEQDDLPF